MKQKIKAKIALSFASPKKEKYFLFIYEVITWEKRKKSPANHYSQRQPCQSRRQTQGGCRVQDYK
jgi:hypothetical protein